jgi:hypothetical protein
MPRSTAKKGSATVRSHSGTKSGTSSQNVTTKSRGNTSSRGIVVTGLGDNDDDNNDLDIEEEEDDGEDNGEEEEDEDGEEEEEEEEMEAAFEAAEEEEEEEGGEAIDEDEDEGHDGDDDRSGNEGEDDEDSKMDSSSRGFLCSAYQGMQCHKCKGYIGFSSRICKHCKAPVKKLSTSPRTTPSNASATSRHPAQRSGNANTSKSAVGSSASLALKRKATGTSGVSPVVANVGKKAGSSQPAADDADKEGRLRAHRSGRTTEDDDMPDHLTNDGAIVMSKSGPVAQMKQLDTREGHAYVHSVSRPKTLPPAPCFAPLSPLNGFSMKQIEMHVRALQGETFQRRYRLVVTRLMEHTLNSDLFNSPVDPTKYQIADYFEVIKQPMDLGTVRQKLEAGRYNTSEELAADVLLTFNNAMRYNPVGHHVYNAAWRLKDEFSADYSRLTNKTEGEAKRKDAHKCGFCHGQMCKLCGDKCLRFDPPIMSCDCCMERIKRGDVYYRAPSGQRWCARCVSNGGVNAEPGAILPPIALLRTTSTATLEGMMKLLGAPGTGHIAAAALAASSSGPQKVNSFERQLPTLLDGSASSSSYGASGSGEVANGSLAASHSGGSSTQKSKTVTGAAVRKSIGTNQQQQQQQQPQDKKELAGSSKTGSGAKSSSVPPLQIATPSAGGKSSSLLNLGGSHHAATVSAVAGSGGAPAPSSSKKKDGLKQDNPSSIGAATARSTTQTELSSSSSSSGLSPAQLLAALKAAGVDTNAVASAAQAAAALQNAPATSGRLHLLTLQSLAAVLRGRHERRRNDDVVAEPWVQCDRCKGWVHQICAMFNARKNALLPFNAEYICPCCRLDDLKASQGTVSSRSRAGSRADKQVSPEGKNSSSSALIIPQVSFAPANSYLTAPPVPPPNVRTRSNLNAGDGAASAGSGISVSGTTTAGNRGHVFPPAGSGTSGSVPLNRSGTTRQAPAAPLIQFSSTIKYEGHAAIATAAALGVGSADDVLKETGGKSKTLEVGSVPANSGAAAPSSPLPESHGTAPSGAVVLSASADPYVTAGSLPHTPLSKELETKVRERLRAELKNNPDVADSIVVRVVSSLKKSIIVPKEVVSCFTADAPSPSSLVETAMNTDCLVSTATESVARQNGVTGGGEPSSSISGRVAATASPLQKGGSLSTTGASSNYAKEYASEYTYRQRVVLLWQRLDGVDMCLFALFVQEYGPDCPPPNTRKIYIAYLDSVRYLRPISARTACYHELLAAYLGNARRRGFDTCHIWACE